jgi:ribosomal protein S18 acetylase RimI-like enzyme
MLLNKTIRLFLDSIGRREEYEFYLGKFKSADTACFALLVPDLESLEQGVDALAFDLNFLLRLGLRPAVVLYGPGADVKWNLLSDNELFEKAGVPTLGKSEDTVPVFFQPLEELLPTIGKRVHFIRAAGGFDTDYFYTQKQNSVVLDDEEQALADTAAALLAARPGTHISVTSPMNLLKEIFTVKGAGTLFRRGSVIIRSDFPFDFAPLDTARDSQGGQRLEKEKLLDLLEQSFKRTPRRGALDQVTTVYLEENYRGAVLLEEQEAGLYLSKFAVGPEARGEGLAQELWDEVCKNHASFFWRSRVGNSVNLWYDRQADGYYTTADWMIFWRGMPPVSLPGLIEFCVNRPSDFES